MLKNMSRYWSILLTISLTILSFQVSVYADSLELKLTGIDGLENSIHGQTEHLISVQECSPICSLVGTESITDTRSAHFISSEGIKGKFRLIITIHKRTRPPPQEREEIPVEVIEQETSPAEFAAHLRKQGQSSTDFEAYGRVLITGFNAGERGNLNHNWRYKDESIARFVMDTSVSAVRRCRKTCQFSSNASFFKTFPGSNTLDTPSFDVKLATIRESATVKTKSEDLLFAGYFTQAVERSLFQDLSLPFSFPGESPPVSTSSISHSQHLNSCTKYNFVASVGDDVAYVWRLSTLSSSGQLEKALNLDNARSLKSATVVVFKDVPSTSPQYQDFWGRGELVPTDFSGSVLYEQFSRFGKVHRGFHARYNQIAEELRTWLRPGTHVLVTGSFSGGAMAALAFADWLSDRNMDIGLTFGVTFGATQVGDKLFQRAFRELGRHEESRMSYGFFEQLVSADEQGGKLDFSSKFPSSIFENFAPYPGVHSLDCLRTIFSLERFALSSPGHLRTYRSVGRRRYIHAGKHLRASHQSSLSEPSLSTEISNETMSNAANSLFLFQKDRMNHYMERLTSLYAETQALISSTHPISLRLLRPHSNQSQPIGTCSARVVPPPTHYLSLSIEGTKVHHNLGVGVNLCGSCSPDKHFNQSLCRAMPSVSNSTHPNVAMLSESSEPVHFTTLQPWDEQSCVQVVLHLVQKSATCANEKMPTEALALKTMPLVELHEVLGCTKSQRCGLKMEGVNIILTAKTGNLVERNDDAVRGSVLSKESDAHIGDVQEKDKQSLQVTERENVDPQTEIELEDNLDDALQKEKSQRVPDVSGDSGNQEPAWEQLQQFEARDIKELDRTSGSERTEHQSTLADSMDVNERQKSSAHDFHSFVERRGEGNGMIRNMSRRDGLIEPSRGNNQPRVGQDEPEMRAGASVTGEEYAGNFSKVGVGGSGTRVEVKQDMDMVTAMNTGYGYGAVKDMDVERERQSYKGSGLSKSGRSIAKEIKRLHEQVDRRRGREANGPRLGMTVRGNTAGDFLPTFSRVMEMKGRAVCETERWCECKVVRESGCVKRVIGEGLCEWGRCLQWKCGCGGGRMCEKSFKQKWEMLERRGDIAQEGVGRCVRLRRRRVSVMEK